MPTIDFEGLPPGYEIRVSFDNKFWTLIDKNDVLRAKQVTKWGHLPVLPEVDKAIDEWEIILSGRF